MAYTTASGHPDMSGIYIPQLWAAALLISFYDATVFGGIANTDYEGEIRDQGYTVNIPELPDITIRDHAIGQVLEQETPETSKVQLEIDKGKYYNVAIDAVEEKQSKYEYVNEWAEHGGEKMKIAIDTDVLANVYASVSAYNSGATAGKESGDINLGATGSPLALTKANILDYIVDCGTVLDEQSVPETGRWLVLPAWACGLIKKSDLKDASLSGDNVSVMRNGRLGIVDRFTLYSSNNIKKTTDGAYTAFNAIFGHKVGLTFASQLVKNEIIDNPKAFGKLMRGLQVFGYKVVKPEALGHLYIRKG